MNRKILLGLAASVSVAACVFLIAVLVGQGLAQASLWAAILAALAAVTAVALALWALPEPSKVLVPPGLEVQDWVVDRPTEAARVVAALSHGRPGTVGITTALQGAGGFGKTTLARVVCADRRIRERFSGGIYLVTVGRDVRAPTALAAKVNEVIKSVTGEDMTFTDPELAGQRLGALLEKGPRRLLVLDDVWEARQLEPFAAGGRRCARLVTTRDPGLLEGRGEAVRVEVDQMSQEQARKLLTSGLSPLDDGLVSGLLEVTGRWPLLLRLTGKILANAELAGADLNAVGAQLLQRLRAHGPAAVDDLSGEAGRSLDVGQPKERERAVRATIVASTSLLDPSDAQRFAELGVFAEDETIPFGLIARLWHSTGGLVEVQASQVCRRLIALALVSPAGTKPGGIALHDVVRDFLRAELAPQRLAELNAALVEAAAAGLPPAALLDTATTGHTRVAWWNLDRSDVYLWDHLVEHLTEAGRYRDAEDLASDLRWVGARLEESGPTAPAVDLSFVGTPRAVRLRAELGRVAHLLSPTEPTWAVVDVLHSRIASDPDWGTQVAALRDAGQWPRLVNRWPPPDLPDSALRRVLTGHTRAVTAVAIAPNGSWLTTGSKDGTVRIWDAMTGQERVIRTGDGIGISAVAVAPDGRWQATSTDDGKVRAWDTATGQERAVRSRYRCVASATTVTADGRWLVSAYGNRGVRIWDATSGREEITLNGFTGQIWVLAVAPDGSWLATAGHGPVRIWDVATGRRRATLTDLGEINAMAAAPDGSWLVTGGKDGTVRIWDTATAKRRAILAGHTQAVNAVAVSPDGSWLVTGGADGTARIWDTATAKRRAILAGHTQAVNAVAVSPDGSWLVTGGADGTARIWDTATEQERAARTRHRGQVSTMVAAPDGSWLATATRGQAKDVQIWDTVTGQEKAILTHEGKVTAVAVAPDSKWLVTADRPDVILPSAVERSSNKAAQRRYEEALQRLRDKARIWDVNGWQLRAVLTSDADTAVTSAVAWGGSWLATVHGRTVCIWDPASSRQQGILAGRNPMYMLAAPPDGSSLATADSEARTHERVWWDPTTWKPRTPERAIRCLTVWDPVIWKAQLTLPHRRVNAMAAAANGSWLATADGEGKVHIWDVATWQESASLTHSCKVNALAITPDGNWIVTCSDDRTIRVWDTHTWETRALMRVENTIVACAWLNANGLAVGGRAGLYVFDFLVTTDSDLSQTRP